MPLTLSSCFNAVREELGNPANLIQVLEKFPAIRVGLDVPRPCIDAYSVVPWHTLGKAAPLDWPSLEPGELSGWRAEAGHYYGSFHLKRPNYFPIGRCEITNDWTCDISDVYGFSASKSNLIEFADTDEMVETNSPSLIADISHEGLKKNLNHKEIRILHDPDTTDHFTRYMWDRRVFLMNTGGSHHFAAAKYIAARLPAKVALKGDLHTYSLNSSTIASLRNEFDIFVISDEPEIFNAFFEAMRSFKATWLWLKMSSPYNESRAILLPKSEKRSVRVADAFRLAGIIDLGAYLAGLAAQQHAR